MDKHTSPCEWKQHSWGQVADYQEATWESTPKQPKGNHKIPRLPWYNHKFTKLIVFRYVHNTGPSYLWPAWLETQRTSSCNMANTHRLCGCNIAKTACPKACITSLQHCQHSLSRGLQYLAATLPRRPVQKHGLHRWNIANTTCPKA